MHLTAHNFNSAINNQSSPGMMWLRLGFCAVALGISGCNPLDTPAPASPPSAALCHVGQDHEYKFGERTQLHIWDLKISRLKELKAQLLVITDGKVQVASKIEYHLVGWNETHPTADGQLILLIDGPQSGPVQRVPHLALDFKDLPSHSKSESHTRVTIDGSLRSQMRTTSGGDVTTSALVLSAELFVPENENGSFSLGSTLDALVKESKAKRGHTVLVVVLESSS